MKNIVFIDWTPYIIDTMIHCQSTGLNVIFIYNKRLCDNRNKGFRKLLKVINTIYTIDTLSITELESQLRKLHFQIDCVINVKDCSIYTTAIVCHRLKLRFTSPNGIKNCRNKLKTREILERHGINSIKYQGVNIWNEHIDVAPTLQFPLVIKPVIGHSSFLASIINKKEDFKKQIQVIKQTFLEKKEYLNNDFSSEFILEEFRSGPILSAEIGIIDGKMFRITMTGRTEHKLNPCIGLGSVVPFFFDSVTTLECFEYAENVCRVLGLDNGVFNIEIVHHRNDFYLIEANPRCMGGEMFKAYNLSYGEDFGKVLINIFMGIAPLKLYYDNFQFSLIRKLIPLKNKKLMSSLKFRARRKNANVIFANYYLKKGHEVNRLVTSGRIIISSHDLKDCFKIAEDLSNNISKKLGLRLAQINNKKVFI